MLLIFSYVQVFQKDGKLREFFQIVSTSIDRKGKAFVSTLEGNKRYSYCSKSFLTCTQQPIG